MTDIKLDGWKIGYASGGAPTLEVPMTANNAEVRAVVDWMEAVAKSRRQFDVSEKCVDGPVRCEHEWQAMRVVADGRSLRIRTNDSVMGMGWCRKCGRVDQVVAIDD